MSSLRPLSIALLSALAFAPSAFAQDTSTDTASGKRIAIVGGGAILQPKSDPAPGLKVDGGTYLECQLVRQRQHGHRAVGCRRQVQSPRTR